jgi:hypothetical protein
MEFYYISLFSILSLGLTYGVLALIYWGTVRVTRGVRARAAILSALAVIFLILPVSEELWVARNFRQACDDAGTFINKKVEVEGFYDDTRKTHAGPPTPQAVESFEKSGYRFFEMRGPEKYVRIEKSDGQWKPLVLDRPTARYHFKQSHDRTKVLHALRKFEWVITDVQTGAQLARETTYTRGPSWYSLGIERPTLFCPVSGKYGEKLLTTLYAEVLKPTARR